MNASNQNLIQLDRYLKVLVDNNQDVFWVANEDYSVQLYVSPAYEKIWGYPLSTLYDDPMAWITYIHPEDKLLLEQQNHLPHSKREASYLEQYRIITASGKIRWILDQTYPIYNEDGFVGFGGVAKDITEFKQLEDQLLIANSFLPKLAEKMDHTAFWVRDPSLKKQLYLSKGFEKIWGRSTEFLYQNPEAWLETILPEDRQRNRKSMLSTLEEKGIDAQYADVFRIQRPDGEIRWIKDISFPIFDSENACVGFAGIAEDITKEKLYEIELRQAKERAEEANRAKSNFIASMSHDFRTPLNGILGFAEILGSGKFYPEQKEFIDGIIQAGNALLTLVEEIINFIELDLNTLPVNEDVFNLKQMVQEVILMTTPQAHEKKIELIFSCSESVPELVGGDANRMRRILTNLINNAIKFTDKGHVLTAIELLRSEQNYLWLQIIIEDTGIGIAKENFEYIFGSFNRVEPSYRGRYKGTGLGLTIVKQFVEEMGGSIRLNSQLNHGTIFYCNLPFKKVQPAFEELPKHEHFSDLKILVIDDYVKRGKTFLSQYGLKKANSINSRKAYAEILAAQENNQAYQLIIVDDEVKHFDVIQFAQQVQTLAQPPLLILLLDKNSHYGMEAIEQSGYEDYLMKPLQPFLVQRVLENAHEKLLTKSQPNHRTHRNIIALLVEDDPLTQRVTKWMLEDLKCDVDIAENGTNAIQLLSDHYDIIFLDVGLPDMDGIELAKIIRSSNNPNKNTPIVALTAHVLDKDREKCRAVGMNDFLKKPLFKNDLKRLLLKIIK